MPSATPPPSLRDRLFRPNRWRLWVQFALLGALVLVLPILFTAQRLLDSGRDVLIEHEIIDLSDESNLRVNEFREDMSYLARDVRVLVRDQPKDRPPAEVVRTLAAGVDLPAAPSWDAPDTVRAARRRYLHGTAVGVYAARVGDAPTIDAAAPALPDHPGRRAAVAECVADAVRRLARDPNANSAQSALTFQPPADPDHGRALIGFAQRKDDRGYVLVIDFSQYVRNRQRVSPRHLYVVTDPAGRLLIHPDAATADTRRPIGELADWQYPTFDGRPWFDTALDPDAKRNADAKQRRMAQVVRAGGARLPAAVVPGVEYTYRKGYFGGRDLADTLGEEKAREASRALNERMAALIAADPALRVGEVSPAIGYIEVAHPTTAGLTAACAAIDAWWRETTGGGSGPKWTSPLACRTFQGQLTPLRIELTDDTDPPWLVVAAATEELRQDIDDRFWRVFVRWVLPTLALACVLGIALVMTLTHSVNRLAVAAGKLDRENPPPLPLGGPYEVSQLAHTLSRLSREVLDRDRLLRDRAARYETILRAAGEGVIVTNADGKIEEANKAAGRMFGVKPDELIGRPVADLVTNPRAVLPTDALSADPETTVTKSLDAVQGRRRDGSTFWLELNMKPVQLRDRVVVTCIFRDVTQRKETEARVRRLNDELEGRVRQRTAELEEANTKLEVALKQAEAASQAKDTFVANMSHELRQPLHIIIGFTEALKEEAADLGATAIEPDLNKILAAAKHLLDLINDILDLAKISSGKMELSAAPFPLARLVGEVSSLVGPLAEKNANTFEVDAPADLGAMTADERRVRQILLNLLSNAFKFTRGGRVTLRVRRVTEAGREWVRFAVADTGKGMTSTQVGRLFQRFYQADSSTTRGAGGTGLGLAITQSFSDLMGGQPVRVTSQEGVGSEFTVTLPAEATPTDPVAPSRGPGPIVQPSSVLFTNHQPPADGPPADGRTVLVIDDDPMVRELMNRFLSKEGFRVTLAAGGDEGLEAAARHRPSVITLDVTMPGVDGWTVLGKLKEHPATADIPVVMLTIVDDRGRGFALGAADYLTKPIDWQRLGAILRKFLSADKSDAVLVIDDDDRNREVVRRHLERDGWKVTEAADGAQGLAAVAAAKPGLVLLDLMMPVMDGFEFLDELARRFPAHRIPVVVLTAKDLTPLDFDRLNGRVARIIAKGDLTDLDGLVQLIRQSAKR